MRAYRYMAATGRTLACSTVRKGRCSTRTRRWSCCRSRWRWPPTADDGDDGQRTSRALRRRRCRAVAVVDKTRAAASLTEYCRRYCCWIRWPSYERRWRWSWPSRLWNRGGRENFRLNLVRRNTGHGDNRSRPTTDIGARVYYKLFAPKRDNND